MQQQPYLDFGFGDKTDKHEEEDRDQVVDETAPVVDTEGGHEGTHQHEENGSRAEDSTTHQHTLVKDVRKGDVVIDFNGPFVVAKQIHNVGHGGRHPATSLIVKLVESFRAVSVSVTGGRVFDTVSALEE